MSTFMDWSADLLERLDKEDRANERGDICGRCKAPDHLCLCNVHRLPFRPAVVTTTDRGDEIARVIAFPIKNNRPGICGPEAA